MKGGVKKMYKNELSRFTFRLPKKLLDELKEEAYSKGCSVNSLILQILWKWFEQQKENKEVKE